MKQLETVLIKNKFVYKQVKRNKNKAIYSQHYQENGPIVAYEVFKIKQRKATVIYGKEYPAQEVFPADNNFGYTAWSCRTLQRAEEKFEEIS